MVVVRIGRREVLRNRGHLGVGLRDRHPVAQPRENLHRARAAVGHPVPAARERPLHRHRHVHVVVQAVDGAAEAARRDADDGDLLPVQPDDAADDGRVALEAALPEPVADDRDRRRALALPPFRRVEEAPGHRFHAQHVEVVPRHEQRPHPLGRLVRAHAQRAVAERQRAREARRAVADVAVVEPRRVDVGSAGRDRLDGDDASRVGDARQRLEQHALHPAEDRRRGGDAQREREHGRGREPRVLGQEAEREAQVFHDASNLSNPCAGPERHGRAKSKGDPPAVARQARPGVRIRAPPIAGADSPEIGV